MSRFTFGPGGVLRVPFSAARPGDTLTVSYTWEKGAPDETTTTAAIQDVQVRRPVSWRPAVLAVCGAIALWCIAWWLAG